MWKKSETALNSKYTSQYLEMRDQDFLKLQYSKQILAIILWADASSILAGHTALKKEKEHSQEKAEFLAVTSHLGWQLTENKGESRSAVGKRRDKKY